MPVKRGKATNAQHLSSAQLLSRIQHSHQPQAVSDKNIALDTAEHFPAEKKDKNVRNAAATTTQCEGLATRNANSDKHPGLAILDEDEIKAINKKDRAVAKRQANARQKAVQAALLKIGVNKIAAHEDELLTQLNKDPKKIAHPPPGRITRKVAQPITPPTKDASLLEDNEVTTESHMSRLNNKDFGPDEISSNSEPEVGDDVFMEIDDGIVDSQKNKASANKKKQGLKHGEVRAMIEAQRKMSVTPNINKCKTVGDEGHTDQPNHETPLQKKSKASTQPLSPTIENFNFDYGGIMDDELTEVAPQVEGIKPSHVKVTTRVTHNAPLVKVEALDPSLPRAQRTKPRKERGVEILDLSTADLRQFKTLVRAFRAVLAVQDIPWNNSNANLLEELTFLWKTMFPHLPRVIEWDGKEATVATQRLNEYRSKIGSSVMEAVDCYIRDTCGEEYPTVIEEHVGYLMEKARYMWLTHDSENKEDFEGLFMAPYIIAGMTAHTEMTAGLPDHLEVTEYPCGALALSTAAAERGLKCWASGVKTFGKYISKRVKKEEEFSEANWGHATQAVMASVKNVTRKRWEKILIAAAEAAPSIATPKLARTRVNIQEGDDRAIAVELDSD
ncbi:hypothetical protein C0992_004016 [Termitomyces sp. T32_za158]|nr:hypothetical protein C0992_004016 [Termitomyces sp. T32_za158]